MAMTRLKRHSTNGSLRRNIDTISCSTMPRASASPVPGALPLTAPTGLWRLRATMSRRRKSQASERRRQRRRNENRPRKLAGSSFSVSVCERSRRPLKLDDPRLNRHHETRLPPPSFLHVVPASAPGPQRERNCAHRDAVSSRFGTGVDAFFNQKGQGLWVPARRPGRRVERPRESAAIEARPTRIRAGSSGSVSDAFTPNMRKSL
jgi:hypothetical protein